MIWSNTICASLALFSLEKIGIDLLIQTMSKRVMLDLEAHTTAYSYNLLIPVGSILSLGEALQWSRNR